MATRDEQTMEAILQELADEGQVVKRDGRWGLASWPEERWQLPQPTEEEAQAKLNAVLAARGAGKTADRDNAADLLGTAPRQGPVPGTVAMKLGECWVDGCDNDAYTRASFRDDRTGQTVTGLICPAHIEIGVGGYTDLKPSARPPIDPDYRLHSAPRQTPPEFARHFTPKPGIVHHSGADDDTPWELRDDQGRVLRQLTADEYRDWKDNPSQPVSVTGGDFARMIHEGTVTLSCRECDWQAPADTDKAEAFMDHQKQVHGKTDAEAKNTEAHVTVTVDADLEVDIDGERGRGKLTERDFATENVDVIVGGESLDGTPMNVEQMAEAARSTGKQVAWLPSGVPVIRKPQPPQSLLAEESVDPHRAERDSEAVAQVIADIRAFKVQPAFGNKEGFFGMLSLWTDEAKVIDATPIYHQAVGRGEWNAYEDHPSIAPPFGEFVIGYRNQFGNVIVMHTITVDQKESDGMDPALVEYMTDDWPTANRVDWERVRWRLFISLWLGGRGGDGTAVPTSGPWYGWKIAVYDDGEPADITWIDMGPKPGSDWDMAHCTYLDALYYLNCRNIEYVEPRRSRGFARRMERMGVKVGQIRVFPVARAARRAPRGEGIPVGADSPATAVRGHFAHYGDCCPGRHPVRGLLFGKLQGRFFIPPHARGNADLGENSNTYILEAGR